MKKYLTVATLGIAVWVSPALAQSPAEQVKEYSRMLFSGDYKGAYELLGRDFKSRFPKDTGPKRMQNLSQRLVEKTKGVQSIDILKEDIHGDTALVEYRITFKNGESFTTSNRLTREAGSWRLSMDPAER